MSKRDEAEDMFKRIKEAYEVLSDGMLNSYFDQSDFR